jgi:hypothetical protein
VGAIGLVAQFISAPNLLDYISFFTILSNIGTTALFLYIGLLSKGRQGDSVDFLLGAFTTYMTLTGFGYWLLLRDEPVPIPWINIVLHGIMPSAAIIGWLIYNHTRTQKYKDAFIWLAAPILYLVYAILRIILTGWYAYPFLNPAKVGVGGVLFHVVLLSTATVVIGLITVFFGNKLKK